MTQRYFSKTTEFVYNTWFCVNCSFVTTVLSYFWIVLLCGCLSIVTVMLKFTTLGSKGVLLCRAGTNGVRRCSSYLFLTSALDGVSSQCHAPVALYPWGKDPQYPLDRRLGGPQSWSGHRGWRKNPLPLLKFKFRSSYV